MFKSIMDAMFTGPYMDMYDSFFLMDPGRVVGRVVRSPGCCNSKLAVDITGL